MQTIKLKKDISHRVKNKYPWVFSNEIEVMIEAEPGDIVQVVDKSGKDYGYGFYNKNSLIAIRLLFTHSLPNLDFFITRIREALKYRNYVLPNCNSFRLIYGESDFLPGLIVDKYNDYLCLQTLSAGIEKKKEDILEALISVLPNTKGIYEKNTSNLRNLEGLNPFEGAIFGTIPQNIEINENSIKYLIDLYNSQKTGFYLDQRFNRLFIQKISKNKNVLDCYTNQGGFALNAGLGGADSIIAIDSSPSAISLAQQNVLLNNFKNIECIEEDVENYLESALKKDLKWDLIVLDPPAFAKNKKNVKSALKKYQKINNLAIKLLNNNGILATSSCSQHIFEDVFYKLICKEAEKNNKIAKLVYKGMQSPDHPVLISMPETKYLKFLVFSFAEN